jgi:hypothetical protein
MKKISALLAFVALAFTQLVFANAVVTDLSGTVTVQVGASTPRPLRLGDQVNQGDTVVTGAASTVVLKFDDGQIAALTRNSRMTVSTYRFDRAANSGNVLLSLVQGGMRAVTGLIGRASPRSVSYRAATATIGIRGTDVNIATNGKDVVVSVNDGVITFSFQGQTVTVPTGQAGALLDGKVTSADKGQLQAAIARANPALAEALASISAAALTEAVRRANTGPVSGDPQSTTVDRSTITTQGSGSGTGGGSTSPSRP